MRKDKLIFDEIIKEREDERDTACCIRTDKSGCIQTKKDRCSVRRQLIYFFFFLEKLTIYSFRPFTYFFEAFIINLEKMV